MIVNHGRWNELAEQCKSCEHIHVMALYMGGNHYYSCGKYPLKDRNEICPKFMDRKEADESI